ncbi:MAG: sodium:proton antiporter [Clostridiales Family XIII bacterium]|jgi:Na+/H+ antiporter NhaC|nr:sodium:proton antiporter [Clostridiales Family XIII bacterium]
MEGDTSFGILTLIPAILIIVAAIWSRRSFESLMFGSIIACIMYAGIGFINEITSFSITAVEENAWMYLVLGLFGSFIALLSASKGTFGFAKLIEKFSKTQKRSLFVSWVLGIIIFMDDYLNILTVSACMTTLTDKQRTPREMLAYVVDSTGAPICVIIPLSTWSVYYGGVFAQESGLADMGSAQEIYLQALPYIFYGFTAVLVVPLVCLGIIPKIGSMKKAYERVAAGGRVYSDNSAKLNANDIEVTETAELPKGNLLDFALPMLLLIVIAVWTGDLFLGLVWGIVLCAVMYIPRKIIKMWDFWDAFMNGFKDMIPMIAICLASQVVKMSMDTIGLPAFVINHTLPLVVPETLPAVTFIVVSALAFVTGSTWGVPAVSVPIIAPLAILSGANIPMTLGAVVSGAGFGSHACFYVDATVLTSQACKMDNMEHALSQIPYAAIAGGAAIILYLVFGFVL